MPIASSKVNQVPEILIECAEIKIEQGYQEYCDDSTGEGGVEAGTGMAQQMMERAFPATAQGPAAGKAESINPVSTR
ncbi:hypothetical protein DSO57_1013139 [Entomophthora muscae]|uniref:Uncharacterized protein n=1 Tax=Entomophthora muscae TaxID=34485 RepID=A0ACC2TGM2_9FUNG|nr:hypothetical protein DSO57_1013139 [Entomophthora muscae]